MIIPDELVANCRKNPERRSWLDRLPDVLQELTDRWRLHLLREFKHAHMTCSWIAAVARADGTPAVLKLGMPHMEGAQEIDGLRFWDGDPYGAAARSDAPYDLVQHLHNSEARLHADPTGMVKRLADLTEVDTDRLRLWTFARAAADPRPQWSNLLWMDIARALAP